MESEPAILHRNSRGCKRELARKCSRTLWRIYKTMQRLDRYQNLIGGVSSLVWNELRSYLPFFVVAGSWRPIGHMRPSSPLLDSVRDQFEDYDQLAKDFTRMFLNSEANTLANSQLFDVVFMVGQSKQKVVSS